MSRNRIKIRMPKQTKMLHLNWNSHLAAQADNKLVNKNTTVYTKAWSQDKNNNERFQTLILDVDNILLATDQDKKIHTLHSFKVSGGTLLHPNTKLM
jgi:archaellin